MTTEENFKQFKRLALCDQARVVTHLTTGEEIQCSYGYDSTEKEWAKEDWSALFVGMSEDDVSDLYDEVAPYWHTDSKGEVQSYWGGMM